ncbi:sporulation protein, yteA family [Halobacteroides halobius DSM 5150]|uniref:Sporulation protein, yteA family n=1 Tax=Halobacteroides halobius (strain ATCC 35273 / DSM 5150 / MD-1) TaxID=748449 RepID=L0K9U3_HALHC|nr:TraR/DksA C4-type zinc finger protein [Halobacteroides halobius]AGB40868.1 sporulation protein, yteA family [Halobacteroides halobius DSM 5150]
MRSDLNYYQQRLLKEKERILNQIEGFNEDGYEGLKHNQRYSTGELSKYDNHPADVGSTTFERGKDIGLKDNAKSILIMIDDALEKVESGHYGLCDYCEKEINSERLEAMPYTTICVDCKSKLEEHEEISDRPLEEGIVNDYFDTGGHFRITDDSENIVFDGEDTWQSLASVGTSNTPSDVPGAHGSLDSYIDADERSYQEIYEEKMEE